MYSIWFYLHYNSSFCSKPLYKFYSPNQSARTTNCKRIIMMMTMLMICNNNSDHSEEVTLKIVAKTTRKRKIVVVASAVVVVVIIVANKCSQLYSYCLLLTWIMSTELDDYIPSYSFCICLCLCLSLLFLIVFLKMCSILCRIRLHVNITHWLLFVIKSRTNKFGFKFINTDFIPFILVLTSVHLYVFSPILGPVLSVK